MAGASDSVTFLFVNVGDLPATVTKILWYLGFGDVTRANPAFLTNKIVGVTLASGDKEIFEISPGEDFHFHKGYYGESVGYVGDQGETQRHRDAYIIGCIIYEDSTGPWVPVKDSHYEYQD